MVHGLVYALGGTGILSCLTAADGGLVWQRDLVRELAAPVPMWGFAGSPLILGERLIIYAGGQGEQGLVALDRQTGKDVWGFPSTGMNYSTARPMTLAGRESVVFCDGRGVHAMAPEDGRVLWTYLPKSWKGPAMVDPQQVSPTSLIVALGDGIGVARLEVRRQEERWSVEESWSSNRLRPSFNDSVVFKGHIYGFNQAVFSCVDADTGQRNWHGGRFGFGQAVLLKHAAQMIVAAENGDAVLLQASPERLSELARIPVLNDKTWNHPIVVGNRLYLRNGKEAVCLQLRGSEE